MPSRLWLDATDPEGSRVLHSDTHIPPVPALPNGFNAPPVIPPRHSAGLGDGHRHSLPTKRTTRKNHDDARPSKKSPELISNLIDSLVDIQFPDPIQGEKLQSPKPMVLEQGLRHVRSFDALNDFNANAFKDFSEDDEVNAADFPVVKTGGKSSREQLKKGSRWENALGISSLAHPSNPSLLSLGSQESLVNISVRKREKNRISKDSVKNKSPVAMSAPFRRDTSDSTTTSSKKDGKKQARTPSLTNSLLTEGPSVPDRRSSRQFVTTTPKSQQSVANSPIPESYSIFASKIQEIKKEPTPEPIPEPKTLMNFDLLNGEDTNVTKRIKELKAKKEQREREASLTPEVELDSNGLPTTLYNNSSVTSGNTKPSKRTKNPPAELKLTSSKLVLKHGGSETHSQPITPISNSDLPINYSFVVQSLENRPSSQAGLPRFTETPVQQTQRPSTAHGKASTLSRSTVSKTFFGTKRDSSVASLSRKKKERKSLETHSTEATLVNSNRESRSNSLTGKKRWSISEMPNGVERHSSLKGVQGAPNKFGFSGPTLEESSLQDDVDNAVEKFLGAKRLSQKIKHPESGRVISFSEVGSRKGNVVFCCVGMGITRFATTFYDELAATLNLRIITPDRPGVGESEANPIGSPLSWADDIVLICSTLGISKFSLLAHSAGAIYALATALRIPQNIRGKVHLLAPWIPPSQMEPVGMHQDSPPAAQLPRSQRFLRALPATFLKVANSSFLSATSASLSPNIGNGTQRKKRKSENQRTVSNSATPAPRRTTKLRPESIMLMDQSMPSDTTLAELARSPTNDVFPSTPTASSFNKSIASAMAPHTRSVSAPLMSPMPPTLPPFLSLESPDARRMYDEALIAAIWDAATANANPLVDLLVCLERTQTIGFRYVDITRSVIIHHGAKDTRVPVDNVKWLGNAMRRCEVRVLEGEGHGLMASASVMGSVLQEMAKEWEEWANMVNKGRLVS